MGKKKGKDRGSREEDDIDLPGKEVIIIIVPYVEGRGGYSHFVCLFVGGSSS